jgi:hypothetical protein
MQLTFGHMQLWHLVTCNWHLVTCSWHLVTCSYDIWSHAADIWSHAADIWSHAAMTFTLRTILWAVSLIRSEWCCPPIETNGPLDLMDWKQKTQIKKWLAVFTDWSTWHKLCKSKRNLLEYVLMSGHIKVHLKNILEMCSAAAALTTHITYPSLQSTWCLLLTGTPSSTPADQWPFYTVWHTKDLTNKQPINMYTAPHTHSKTTSHSNYSVNFDSYTVHIDCVQINQLNALNYIPLYFSFTMAPICFSKTMPSSGSNYVPLWATSASVW